MTARSEDTIEYSLGKVIRQSTDGNSMQHKLQLYVQQQKGNWVPATGKGAKRTFASSDILLVGLHLTERNNKIRKHDMAKINAAIEKM